ncbi:MAG: hypothetical protein LBD51_02035, partial [Bifidobacteriaceae bacterium]|nr:hypothetical protein [Bifidobacteriaceae bacterium]
GLVAAPGAGVFVAGLLPDAVLQPNFRSGAAAAACALIAAGGRKIAAGASPALPGAPAAGAAPAKPAPVGPPLRGPLGFERASLEVLAIIALSYTLGAATGLGAGTQPAALFALVAAAALLTGQDHRRRWAVPAGAALAAAAAAAAAGLEAWQGSYMHTAGALALAAFGIAGLLAALAASWPLWGELRNLLAGAAGLTALLGLPPLAAASLGALLPDQDLFHLDQPPVLWVVALWAPAGACALLAAVRWPRGFRAAAYWTAPLLAAGALAGWATLGPLPAWFRFGALGLLAAAAMAGAYWATRALGAHPRARRAARATAWVAGFAMLAPFTTNTAGERPLIALAGLAAPAVILGAGLSMGARAWPALTGAAYAYFLVDLHICLGWYAQGPDQVAAVGIAAGGIVLALTLAPRPRLATWGVAAALSGLVLALPAFGLLIERTWLGAGAAGTLAAAATALALNRTRATPVALRAVGAALAVVGAVLTLVPALALLTPGSASRWLFPLIAVVASAAAWGGCALRRRSAPNAPAAAAVGATLIATGAVLGALALAICLSWPVTGAQTVLAASAILAAGSAAVATARGGAKLAWWYTGAMACVALWSALAWGEVGVVEAYTLPPAALAGLCGAILAARRRGYLGLLGAGCGLAVLTPLVLLGLPEAQLARALELVALGLLALAAGYTFTHLRGAMAATAAVAAAGPLLAGLMIGQLASPPASAWPWFAELSPLAAYPSLLFALAAAFGLVAAAGWAAAGWQARSLAGSAGWGAWWAMPALAAAALVPVSSMRFTWWVVGGMVFALLCYLALTIAAARLQASGRVLLPPPWAIWLVALAVGIAGWSTRELRVECFALPLGLALFAAGLIVGGKARGYGSPGWAVAPGVAATLGPSTLAVGTDPLTWRAIMVLALGLAFMLLSVRAGWKPPVFVCASSMILSLALALLRHGSISILPWLAALLAVGGSLLALALVFERRARAAGR